MIDPSYAVPAIIAMGLVTFALRALPFVAAPLLRRYPEIDRLGRFLPPAIMTLLVLHTLHGSAHDNPQSGPWAEIVSAALVMVVQYRWKHPLLSIAAGTVLYVVWRNLG
ncbi:branched-chain amino acid transporter permease [Paludibacterium sp. B53371]|uniref:branched-chain amino acid transporter permease n=1 Tax=Paludibacterium sp. B53371 TaxID=2806263 RepID=UPI001C03D90C|nr:AzlD domain-containing protein [Paludibacterium sp. B53371]